MKLSITDQFLYDLLVLIDEGAYTAGKLFGPRRSIIRALPYHRNPVLEKYRKEKSAKALRKIIYYLKTNNYIKVKSLEGNKGIMLTSGGIAKALRTSMVIEAKQKRKDGKWIMIIFDVPQKYQKSRNILKSILLNSGYKLLQQSVWVNPYDVYEKTVALLQHHDLERYVKIFIIEAIR